MRDTIEMAREAGYGENLSMLHAVALNRFAELVRADERNRTWTQEHWTEYERSIAAQEREACAKVCDEQAERSKRAMEKSKRTTDHAVYRAGAQTAAWNAAEIRARSNT